MHTINYTLRTFNFFENLALLNKPLFNYDKKKLIFITCIALMIITQLTATLLKFYLSFTIGQANQSTDKGIQKIKKNPCNNKAIPSNVIMNCSITKHEASNVIISSLPEVLLNTSLQDKILDDFYCPIEEEIELLLRKYEKIFEYLKKMPPSMGIKHSLDQNMEKFLLKYPKIAFLDLSNEKDFYNYKDRLNKICNNFRVLSQIDEFIDEAFNQINLFLNQKVFDRGCFLSEDKKNAYINFHPLFDFINQFFPLILSNPDLVLKLKIKFSNLPLPKNDRRSNYCHLYLSEKEQVHILFNHFEAIEMNKINQVLGSLKGNSNLGYYTISKIYKLVNKEFLTSINLFKLKQHLSSLNPFISNCKDEKELFSCFVNFSSSFNKKDKELEEDVITLYRASKAKKFFEQQLELDENQIRIPRWYHATRSKSLKYIINPRLDVKKRSFIGPFLPKVEVRNSKCFLGAWVSTQWETDYGPNTFAFTNHISFNAPVDIRYKYESKRWRGVQKAIPLHGTNKLYLAFIGIIDKSCKKEIRKTLEENNIRNLAIINHPQLNYMRKEIEKSIGCPNLNYEWW